MTEAPRSPTGSLRRVAHRTRRRVLAHRRSLAALCAAVAVAATLQANATPPPTRTAVLTAAHDVGAGVVLRAADLRETGFAPGSVPAGVLPDATRAVGRTTTGPLRRGEPVTDVRLVTSSLLEGYPGLVAVPVRIGDAQAVRLLRVGDRIDLLAVDPQTRDPAREVGSDVPVLAIPQAGDESVGLTDGALVVVGLPPETVISVTRAAVTSYLAVSLRR